MWVPLMVEHESSCGIDDTFARLSDHSLQLGVRWPAVLPHSMATLFGELPWELLRNPIGQGIGKHHHVVVSLVVGCDVRSPVFLEPRHNFSGGEIEVLI